MGFTMTPTNSRDRNNRFTISKSATKTPATSVYEAMEVVVKITGISPSVLRANPLLGKVLRRGLACYLSYESSLLPFTQPTFSREGLPTREGMLIISIITSSSSQPELVVPLDTLNDDAMPPGIAPADLCAGLPLSETSSFISARLLREEAGSASGPRELQAAGAPFFYVGIKIVLPRPISNELTIANDIRRASIMTALGVGKAEGDETTSVPVFDAIRRAGFMEALQRGGTAESRNALPNGAKDVSISIASVDNKDAKGNIVSLFQVAPPDSSEPAKINGGDIGLAAGIVVVVIGVLVGWTFHKKNQARVLASGGGGDDEDLKVAGANPAFKRNNAR